MNLKTLAILFSVLLTATTGLNAQDQTDWLNNTMFESGKIKVVAAVIAAAFVLIVAYLIHLDRKVGKLEKREKNEST